MFPFFLCYLTNMFSPCFVKHLLETRPIDVPLLFIKQSYIKHKISIKKENQQKCLQLALFSFTQFRLQKGEREGGYKGEEEEKGMRSGRKRMRKSDWKGGRGGKDWSGIKPHPQPGTILMLIYRSRGKWKMRNYGICRKTDAIKQS